jgi:hypothetical protein
MKRIVSGDAVANVFARYRWATPAIAAVAILIVFVNSAAAASDHALCGTVVGNDVFVNVAQGDDCSSPAPVLFSGSLQLGNIATDAASTATFDGTTTANGTATFNGATTFNGGNTFNGTATFANDAIANGSSTFNGTGTFNSSATFNGTATFNGPVSLGTTFNTQTISNTGNISTDTLSTTGNATIGGTLAVTGAATFNGITNTGNMTTDTLTANTSINTPLITATTANVTTANVTTANITTANVTTANVTTANIGTANVATALLVSPGATVNMGGNLVQNVGTPVAGTDAANKNYVDASIAGVTTQIDQSLASLSTRIDDVSQRTTKATAGVAMAFAMAGVPTVLPNERVAFTMNYGNFQGQNGVAINGAVRLNDNFQLTGGVGFAANQNIAGARAGLRVGW